MIPQSPTPPSVPRSCILFKLRTGNLGVGVMAEDSARPVRILSFMEQVLGMVGD